MRVAHGVGTAGDALRTAVLPLCDEARALQYGHVLLHGRERHRIVPSQLAHGRVGVHHAREDVAPRGVSECPEQLVHRACRRLLTYNHTVVYHATHVAGKLYSLRPAH
jgi:hypothetical protein